MVVEHAHGLRQRRGPNAKSSLHKAHLAPDAGLQAPGASLSFAQGSHDFESLDRGIGRGDRFETAHRLDQYLELSVIGLDHVIEILHLPVGRLPVQLSFALQFGDRCTIARRFVGIERGRLFPVLQASQGLAQEPLRCLGAAGRRQVEIDRCQQRVKSDPLTATTNGLILIHLVYSGLASAITPAFRFCFSR